MERKHKQFKLKDLAVVLVVILVLAPILAAGLRHGRALSAQVECAENLKALGVAAEMYQADWDDVLVPYGAPFSWNGKMWPQLLGQYTDPSSSGTTVGKLYKCPGASAVEQTGFAFERSYGINVQCGGWMPGTHPEDITVVPVKKVRYPGSTIRIAETQWQAQGGSFFAATPANYYPNDPTCHMFATRHNSKGNVLWIDGHVSAMTIDQYNMRDSGPYQGQIWLRPEGPKPPVAN